MLWRGVAPCYTMIVCVVLVRSAFTSRLKAHQKRALLYMRGLLLRFGLEW